MQELKQPAVMARQVPCLLLELAAPSGIPEAQAVRDRAPAAAAAAVPQQAIAAGLGAPAEMRQGWLEAAGAGAPAMRPTLPQEAPEGVRKECSAEAAAALQEDFPKQMALPAVLEPYLAAEEEEEAPMISVLTEALEVHLEEEAAAGRHWEARVVLAQAAGRVIKAREPEDLGPALLAAALAAAAREWGALFLSRTVEG